MFVFVRQVRESEDFYNLSKDKLLELILSDELEIEDEQASAPVFVFRCFYCATFTIHIMVRRRLCSTL